MGGAQGVSPKEGVRIIPDEENNLLVVVAPPHEWNIISGMLQQLDIMPRQVLNEVLIAEVRLTDDLKYGIEFLLGGMPAQVQTSTGTSDDFQRPQRGFGDRGQHHNRRTGTSAADCLHRPGPIPGVDVISVRPPRPLPRPAA